MDPVYLDDILLTEEERQKLTDITAEDIEKYLAMQEPQNHAAGPQYGPPQPIAGPQQSFGMALPIRGQMANPLLGHGANPMPDQMAIAMPAQWDTRPRTSMNPIDQVQQDNMMAPLTTHGPMNLESVSVSGTQHPVTPKKPVTPRKLVTSSSRTKNTTPQHTTTPKQNLTTSLLSMKSKSAGSTPLKRAPPMGAFTHFINREPRDFASMSASSSPKTPRRTQSVDAKTPTRKRPASAPSSTATTPSKRQCKRSMATPTGVKMMRLPGSWKEAAPEDVLMFELKASGSSWVKITETWNRLTGLGFEVESLKRRYQRIKTKLGQLPETLGDDEVEQQSKSIAELCKL
ncbi:uncharacterized protein N7459_006451 [Penicillium hispanicum]|uniref:uncharacterized protein n=1 Tax=Penicillium hispanicum TaxID=1080232 RepID=UPI0025422A01|nr:uncharacterized protein N7459_006451 [Penicillium hispanicum]KAJ5577487.1 hypothetical protein N7459_006451 [Penicillium hispanicum]